MGGLVTMEKTWHSHEYIDLIAESFANGQRIAARAIAALAVRKFTDEETRQAIYALVPDVRQLKPLQLQCGHPAQCLITKNEEQVCGWCEDVDYWRSRVLKIKEDAGVKF